MFWKYNLDMIKNDIISYREMCDSEGIQTLQRGMNYRLKPEYSVILLSQRSNAPYKDKVHSDGVTIEYEGHDVSKDGYDHNPKTDDQIQLLPSGRLTQNGLFIKAVNDFKKYKRNAELVKAYEKILPGVWSLKGIFELIDYDIIHDGIRNVYKFVLRLAKNQKINIEPGEVSISHTRIIPSEVKMQVWKRDHGECVLCGSSENLHFDHDLPFSRGGTSLTSKNVRLLCMRHNLKKSAKIE